MTELNSLLMQKIHFADYRHTITQLAASLSVPEQNLLIEIMLRFDFDVVQEQALVQAVRQQSRFDPNAGHWGVADDEDITGVCPHCLNPPAPPLRDYLLWREQQAQRVQAA